MPEPKLYDPDTERALVGAALIEPALFADTIDAEDFYLEDLRTVWETGRALLRDGKQPDILTLGDELERRGSGVKASLLTKLVNGAVSTAYAPQWAATVSDYAVRRKLYNTASTAMMQVQRQGNLDLLLAQFGCEIRRLQETRTAAHPVVDVATWADLAQRIGPVVWEWPGWLPSGMLVELVADSGAGKSTLALRIAATFLLGWAWPDGAPHTGKTGKVLWCETEAGQAINLERAHAWGLPIADILSPLLNPLDDVSLLDPAHLAAIEAVAARDEIRLIVVDSLSGGTAGREKAEDQMPVVKWLAELARNLGKPVVLLHHLRKRGLSEIGVSDTVTLDRVRGSTVIVQPARVVWALDAPNVVTPDHKRLSVIKSNLGRLPKAIGVHIDDGGLRFGEAPTAPKVMGKLDQAKLLLLRLLADGPRLQTDIEAAAVGEEIGMDTMREAKKKLGCQASRDGHSGKWSWSLPDAAEQDAEQDGDA